MERPNLVQQKIYLDLARNSISSDNNLFDAETLSVEQLVQTTPILEHYLELARSQAIDAPLTLPMIENPNEFLKGYFKFEFVVAPNQQFIWKITDLNTVKENMFSVQQGSNEQEIIKQLFFKGEEKKSSILSFIESEGDNYLVRLKKILTDLANHQIEFLPLIKHCFPDKWPEIPNRMLQIYSDTVKSNNLQITLDQLFDKYPKASLQLTNGFEEQDETKDALARCTYYLAKNVLSFCHSANVHITINPNRNRNAIKNVYAFDIGKAKILDDDKIIDQLIRFHLFYMELNNHSLNLSIEEKSKFFSSKLSFEIYKSSF